MRFEIRYEAEYRYSEPVSDSLNTLRIRPAVTSTQTIESFGLDVSPESRIASRRDYFGTDVFEFEVAEPHDKLSIVAHASVVTDEVQARPTGGWDQVGEDRYRFMAGEHLLDDPDHTPSDEAIADLVDAVRADSPLETALQASEVVPDRFEYDTESTFVASTVSDLLEAGGGVCQDFVHLALVLLRRSGLGARYVSGYFFTAPDGVSDSAEVQTHAWVEALIPAETGEPRWVAVDPTNRGYAGEDHVKIGHGRRYQDVPPIRGVYRGPASEDVDVHVRMHRVNGDGSG